MRVARAGVQEPERCINLYNAHTKQHENWQIVCANVIADTPFTAALRNWVSHSAATACTRCYTLGGSLACAVSAGRAVRFRGYGDTVTARALEVTEAEDSSDEDEVRWYDCTVNFCDAEGHPDREAAAAVMIDPGDYSILADNAESIWHDALEAHPVPERGDLSAKDQAEGANQPLAGYCICAVAGRFPSAGL